MFGNSNNKSKTSCEGYMRFIAIDEFNEPIRRFNTMREAKLYIRNKRGFTVQEISLISIFGEALL